jgi:hypothetical protein
MRGRVIVLLGIGKEQFRASAPRWLAGGRDRTYLGTAKLKAMLSQPVCIAKMQPRYREVSFKVLPGFEHFSQVMLNRQTDIPDWEVLNREGLADFTPLALAISHVRHVVSS